MRISRSAQSQSSPVERVSSNPPTSVSRERRKAGWTTKQIESALVSNYGQGILAAPSHKGFDLLAWWLPIVGVLAGAVVLAFGVWRWSRRKEPEEPDGGPAGSGLDEETERRLDDLLARFD